MTVEGYESKTKEFSQITEEEKPRENDTYQQQPESQGSNENVTEKTVTSMKPMSCIAKLLEFLCGDTGMMAALLMALIVAFYFTNRM